MTPPSYPRLTPIPVWPRTLPVHRSLLQRCQLRVQSNPTTSLQHRRGMGCGNEVLTDPREGVLQDMPNRLWWPSIESALYLRKTSEVGDQSRPDLQARVQATAAQRLPSPARGSRVIAIDDPTGSLQPMGLAQGFVALGPACCSAAPKRRTTRDCQHRTLKPWANTQSQCHCDPIRGAGSYSGTGGW